MGLGSSTKLAFRGVGALTGAAAGGTAPGVQKNATRTMVSEATLRSLRKCQVTPSTTQEDASSSTPKVPNVWEKVSYYHNPQTGETTWERPPGRASAEDFGQDAAAPSSPLTRSSPRGLMRVAAASEDPSSSPLSARRWPMPPTASPEEISLRTPRKEHEASDLPPGRRRSSVGRRSSIGSSPAALPRRTISRLARKHTAAKRGAACRAAGRKPSIECDGGMLPALRGPRSSSPTPTSRSPHGSPLPTPRAPSPSQLLRSTPRPSPRAQWPEDKYLIGNFLKAGGPACGSSAAGAALAKGLRRWQARVFVFEPKTRLLVYFANEADADAAIEVGVLGHRARGYRKVTAIDYDNDRTLIFTCEPGGGTADTNIVAMAACPDECRRWADASPARSPHA